jgi:hypothetical protein
LIESLEVVHKWKLEHSPHSKRSVVVEKVRGGKKNKAIGRKAREGKEKQLQQKMNGIVRRRSLKFGMTQDDEKLSNDSSSLFPSEKEVDTNELSLGDSDRPQEKTQRRTRQNQSKIKGNNNELEKKSWGD